MRTIIPTWVHFLEMAAILAVALWRGGGEERIAAGFNLVSNALYVAFGAALGWDQRFAAAWGLFEAVSYLAIGLRSQRWWTLAAASVALVNFATAVAGLSAPFRPWTFGSARLLCFYLLSLAILVGAWTAPPRPRPNGRGPALEH